MRIGSHPSRHNQKPFVVKKQRWKPLQKDRLVCTASVYTLQRQCTVGVFLGWAGPFVVTSFILIFMPSPLIGGGIK